MQNNIPEMKWSFHKTLNYLGMSLFRVSRRCLYPH